MGYTKLKLDKTEINILRWTYSDKEIMTALHTSFGNIKDQCGTRQENGIPVVVKKKGFGEKREQDLLNFARMKNSGMDNIDTQKIFHKEPVVEEYWKNEKKFGKVLNVGLNPLPGVVLLKNTVGYTF